MALTVLITLTTAGADTGPFDLYSNTDGYTTPFETGIAKAALEGGYLSVSVPDSTTTIRVLSDSELCENYVDLAISGFTTTTTTSTSTSTTTSTSTSTTSTSTSTTTSTTTTITPEFTLQFSADAAVTDVRVNGVSIPGFAYPVTSPILGVTEPFTPAGTVLVEVDVVGSPGSPTLRITDSGGNHDEAWIGNGTYSYPSINSNANILFTMF